MSWDAAMVTVMVKVMDKAMVRRGGERTDYNLRRGHFWVRVRVGYGIKVQWRLMQWRHLVADMHRHTPLT